MNAKAFNELLSYMDVVINIACDEAPEAPDLGDVLGRAMKMLTPDQLTQIPSFVDEALSTTQDPKRLARLFATGSSYRVWRSDDGPRNALLEIKKAAIALASSPAR